MWKLLPSMAPSTCPVMGWSVLPEGPQTLYSKSLGLAPILLSATASVMTVLALVNS
jgi:hypothetical protein